ncbi:hypothetical protein [Fodinicurvata sp. EGI_FJ10296]|uniref:hypothetical protein n=1 Tax=Fodinicurvata sp. EGI_FJ10296 TaxID=3231908 RepID=UPI003454AFF0
MPKFDNYRNISLSIMMFNGIAILTLFPSIEVFLEQGLIKVFACSLAAFFLGMYSALLATLSTGFNENCTEITSTVNEGKVKSKIKKYFSIIHKGEKRYILTFVLINCSVAFSFMGTGILFYYLVDHDATV